MKFIAVYTDPCYTIFWHSETSQHFQTIFLNSHVSLTSHLHLGCSGCLFPVCCITEILYAFHSNMHTKCLPHFILLNLSMWIVFGIVQLWLHSLYIITHLSFPLSFIFKYFLEHLVLKCCQCVFFPLVWKIKVYNHIKVVYIVIFMFWLKWFWTEM